MRRDLMRPPLCALLSGLMLVACGGSPEEGLSPSEEPLGTQEAALCVGLSVSSLSILGVSSYGGVVAGSGSWAVSTGANAIKLVYSVDGVERSSEERPGTSGTWNFSSSGLACGSHTFEVKAFPMVIDSAGNRTTCTDSPRTLSQAVTQDCPTATLSCSRASTTSISCTGSGSGGTSPYTYLWQDRVQTADGTIYTSGWGSGSASQSFYCRQGGTRDDFERLTIQFKVRDGSGMESTLRAATYTCAP